MNNKTQFLQKCLPFDFETTGLDFKTAEVIEMGWTESLEGNWDAAQNILFKPSTPISPKVSSITDITDEMVTGQPSFNEIGVELVTALAEAYSDGYFVAHNAFYDRKVLERYADLPINWLCTMRMAQKIYVDDPSVEEFTLGYLRYRFKLNIDFKGDTHRADFDAYMGAKLLEHLIGVMEERGILDINEPYAPQIEIWMKTPIISKIMSFGKEHRGKLMVDVPIGYYKWMFKNVDKLNSDHEEYDEDLAESIAYAIAEIEGFDITEDDIPF